MTTSLEKIKRKHAELRDRNGNPLTPLEATRLLDFRKATVLRQLRENITALEKMAAVAPQGTQRRRAMETYLGSVRDRLRALAAGASK